ncbi:MAG: hypothetical protein IKB70_06515 [Bacilli bacterium]|nr:hypothetical protein [Bacilli bacterium]
MKVALKTFVKELENSWYCCFDRCAYGDAATCFIGIRYEDFGVDKDCEPLLGEITKIVFNRIDNDELYISIDYKMLNDENIKYDNGRYEICGSGIPPFYLLGVMKLN